MLKKILAGSTAGILAVTAMASTAMAADNDTIVLDAGQTTTKVEYVEFDLQGEINGLNLYKLLVNSGAASIPGGAQTNWEAFTDSENAYSNMLLALWVNPTKTFWAMNEKWESVPFYNANGNNTLLKLNSQGKWESNKDQLGNDVLTISNVEFSTKLEASVQKYTLDPGSTPPNLTYNPDGDPTSDTTTATAGGSGSLISATGNANAGVTTAPVNLSASFGLGSKKGLKSINFDVNKSDITVKFTVKLPYEVFRGLDKDQTAGLNWDWTNPDWNLINKFFQSEAGSDIINDYFGVVGESGVWDKENKNFTKKGSVGVQDVKVKMVSDIKTSSDSKSVQKYWPKKGTVPVGVAQNANLAQLKNMNKGGTVTFEFDKDMSKLVTANVIFYSTSGQMALPLNADFAFSEDGKTMSVDFPAGLTYSEQLNTYNSFKMMYEINDESTSGVVDNTSGSLSPDTNENTNFAGVSSYGNHLVKITFKAGASSNNGDNGGLVEDDNKPSNSGNNSGSTPSNTNSGSNTGDNKNPSTGVAVAVAPVALAATAAAIVISKKRK